MDRRLAQVSYPSAPRRVVAIFLTAATLATSLAVSPPLARAEQIPASSSSSAPLAGRADDALVTAVEPAPITVDLDRRGGGYTGPLEHADLQLTPEGEAYAAPVARTELPERRDQFSRVFANPDGTFDLEVSQARLNFRDAGGDWQPIDLSLEPEGDGPYGLRVKANDRTTRFSTGTAGEALALLDTGDWTLGVRAFGYGAGTQRDGKVIVAGSGANGAVEAIPVTDGFEFRVIIDRSDRATTYHFAIDAGDLDVQLAADGKTIQLMRAEPSMSGEPRTTVVGGITAPMLLEGGRDEGTGEPVTVTLTRRGASDLPADLPPQAVADLRAGETLVSYRIDPTWLHDPARQFPVILDPVTYSSSCIGNGASGCTYNTTTGSFDEFVFNALPDYHTVGWTVLRAGYDDRSTDGGVYGTMRSLLYFPDPATQLPDGAQVTKANLKLTIDQVFGSAIGQGLRLYPVTRGWGTNSVTWNDMHVPTAGYDSATPSPITNVPSGATTGTAMNFDVSAMARSWYTRRAKDWKPNIGMLLRFVNESAAYDEVSYKKYSTTSGNQNRPLLTLTYAVPRVDFDFDTALLGSTYAPSQMVAGQVTKLPIKITNDASGYTFDTAATNANDHWLAGYRFFKADGSVAASGTKALPANIASGASASLVLDVTPPATLGSYTLRLDLVHKKDGATLWSADWAKPSLYNSRNKKILTSDNTRWTGSSVIERAEFGINVLAGGGTNSGSLESVATAGGGSLGINLNTRNLHVEQPAGVGFADRGLGLGLTYGYDRANATDCGGILGACGWYTNYDEGITSIGGGSFTYQAPSGSRYHVDTTPTGQLVSAAPVRIERERITFFDENRLNWTATAPTMSTVDAFSGIYSQAISAGNLGTVASGPAQVDLPHFPLASLWVRSTGTDRASIGFKVYDRDTGATQWFVYTFGNTAWTYPGGYAQTFIDTGTALTSSAGYTMSQRNLFEDVRAAIPSFGRDLYFSTVNLAGSSGGFNTLYYDALRFQGRGSTSFEDTMPPWTANAAQASLYSGDKMSGTHSIKVNARAIASSPDCVGCKNTELDQYGFLHWNWKKVGGTTIAHIVHLQNKRVTSQTGTITYYAGPDIPPGAVNPVQISPVMPAEWQLVRRDLLNDARQIFNWYNDYPNGSDPAAPPAVGPVGDDVKITGFGLSGVDGNFGLFDYTFHSTSLHLTGAAAGGADYTVFYPDRERHVLNNDGLLSAIVDRDGNRVNLDYSYNTASYGSAAYTLTTIRAPTDRDVVSAGGPIYRRALSISRSTAATSYGSMSQTGFREEFGTSAAPSSGRRADFFVGNAAATGSGLLFGNNDLAMVSPGRNPSTNCWTARPTGCVEFDYTNSTSHSIDEVRDPRWAGAGSGAADLRWGVTYSGVDPWAITDRSKGSNAQLAIITYNDTRVAGLGAKRVIWQDQAARAANQAITEDLSPEGSTLTRHVRKACAANPCVYGTATSYPATPAATEIAARNTFNGLSEISSATTYRCPALTGAVSGCTGSTALATVSRQQSNAAAQVDNVPDALAAARLAWTQDETQHFHSLADSGGTNPDLYRIEYAYDDDNQVIEQYDLVTNRQPDYADAILSTEPAPLAYWRLGEASGNAADSSGSDYSATVGSAVTRGLPGALARDVNAAMGFSGAAGSRVTSTLNLPQAAYSMAAWFKVDTNGQISRGIVGDRGTSDGSLIYLNSSGHISTAHDDAYISTYVIPTPGRWYHVATTWSGSVLKMYLDGELTEYVNVSGAQGNGATTFEIGSFKNGDSTTLLDGAIDEVSVHASALGVNDVLQHYLAGRGVARHATLTSYNARSAPLETHDNFLINGGFESGITGWRQTGTATPIFAAASDPNVNSGSAAMSVVTTGSVRQDVQLVPGQTVRVQFAGKTDGGANTRASWNIAYWKLSTAAWVTASSGDISTSTFSTKAFDVSLPFDTDGSLRLILNNSAGSGTAYFDDALIVSGWAKTDYTTANTGLVTDTHVLRPGSSSGATLRTHLTYAAASGMPPIFPTGVTANYVNGVYDSSLPDEDLTTTRSFDAWGRELTVTDPDGVTQTTHYRGSGNGAFTDADWVADGLDNRTSTTHDQVGNALTVTAPSGEQTATAYDLVGNPVTITAPDGVRTQHTYDNFNRLTSTAMNHVDGAPGGAAGNDDVITSYTYDGYGNQLSMVADDGTFSGAIKRKTSATYDLLANRVSSTAYADSAASQPRTTTSYFATVVSGGATYTATEPSGSRLPIAPSAAPAPICPGTAGTLCSEVSDLDMNGRAVSLTDTYGVVSVSDYDVAGRSVRSIANYVAGAAATASQNVTNSMAYDIAGNPVRSTDVAGRTTVTTYDAVNRPTVVTRLAGSSDYNFSKTAYRPSGRVERASRPAAVGTADGSLIWTRTEYDAAGRAVRSLQHHDLDAAADAHYRLAAFESDAAGWSAASSGWFIAGGASAASDDVYHPTGPKSGHGRLRIATSSTTTNSGASWDLSGQEFVAGRTYKLRADLLAASGNTLQAFLGVDASGASYASSGGIATTGSWQTLEMEWTPAATVSSNVHFALRKPTAGSLDVFLDNVQVWDVGAADWNIPSETTYDASGRVIASVLPPTQPGGEPMVTTTAYDLNGQAVAVSANARSAYSHRILGQGQSNGLVGYWPLDERGGSSVADRQGSNTASLTGSARFGQAGAVDEARTAVELDGTAYVDVPDAAAIDLAGPMTLEYWARSDTLLDASVPASTWKGGVYKSGAYGLGWYAGSGWRFQIVTGATSRIVTSGGTAAEPGRWYHLVGTYDGDWLRLYVDGTEVGASQIGSFAIDNTSAALRIGQMSANWDGDLDEVALYRAALNSTAVAGNFAAGRPGGAQSLTTRTEFDALGRPAMRTSPRGIRTVAELDRLGRQGASVANYRNGSTSAASGDDDVRSTFAYNALGELLTYCPAKAVFASGCAGGSAVNAWHTAFDAMGRQVSQVPPVNTTTTALDTRAWTYDAGGRLASVIDQSAAGAVNRHSDYTYDALGRALTEQIYLGAGTGNVELSWTNTYNADGTRASRSFDGSAASPVQGSDTYSFTYDALGRPDLVKKGAVSQTDYAWNPDATLASRSDAGLGGSTFSHDWAGRQVGIGAPATFGAGNVRFDYGLDGLLTGRATPNGVDSTLAYDPAKRPLEVDFDGSTLTQTYDRDGNVTSEGRSLAGVSNDAGGNTQSFSYDGLNRVTASSGLARADAFSYDLNGNRLSKTEGGATTTYTYDRSDQLINQTIAGVTTAFTYNVNGDMTASATAANTQTAYGWDAGGRMTSLTPAGSSVSTYAYDALGRMATQSMPSGAVSLSYIGTSHTAYGSSAAGGQSTYALIDAADSRVATDTAGTTAWTMFDLHGNLAGAQAESSPTIVNALRYDTWGKVLDSYSASTGAVATPWRYQGRLDVSPDAANPLYDFGARLYSPGASAFTQLDTYAGTAQNPLSMNRFLYAHANPTTLVDPDGHAVHMKDGGFTKPVILKAPKPAPPLPPPPRPRTPTAPIHIDYARPSSPVTHRSTPGTATTSRPPPSRATPSPAAPRQVDSVKQLLFVEGATPVQWDSLSQRQTVQAIEGMSALRSLLDFGLPQMADEYTQRHRLLVSRAEIYIELAYQGKSLGSARQLLANSVVGVVPAMILGNDSAIGITASTVGIDDVAPLAVGGVKWLAGRFGRSAPDNGALMRTSDALDAAHEYIGPDPTDLGGGRFQSQDGSRQVRLSDRCICGEHGPPHIVFERMIPNPQNPSKVIPSDSRHVYLTDN